MDSPPPSARLSNRGKRYQRMATLSSPKTPSHPSNGYEVAKRRKSHSPVRSSARRRSITINCATSKHVIAINNTGISSPDDSIDTSNIESSLASPVNHSSTKSKSNTDSLAIAVSQDEDYDPNIVGRAQDDVHVSMKYTPDVEAVTVTENNTDVYIATSSAKRRRCQSASTFEVSKRNRRKSLRLHSIGMTGMVVPTLKKESNADKNKVFDSSIQHKKINEKNDAALPTPHHHMIEKSPRSEKGALLPPEYETSISEQGQKKLFRELEKIASGIVGPLPSDNLVSHRKREVRVHAVELESLGMDNTSNDDVLFNMKKIKTKKKNRRDTFDLSKKRGLASSAKHMELDVFVNDHVMKNESPDHQNDFVTPKAGQSETTWKYEETGDHQGNDVDDNVQTIEENTVVMKNLEYLTQSALEAKISQLFPNSMGQIYKLPCVSARIFAAMNIVYENTDNFTPLLPLFHSLIEAEIVSLQYEEQHETVCFINKKVCFSGFDYSSTITAVGAVVGQGGGDLLPSIDVMRGVLEQAMKLPKPMYYLDVAIQCLHCMSLADGASQCLSETMFGYFPMARFQKAITYYLNEMRDFKHYLSSETSLKTINDHSGVRNRLNDFIGRSIRYHLRGLLNSIPESVVKFNVGECEERWGRAVDDGSISSILNFSLVKIHELMTVYPNLIEYGDQNLPRMFAREQTNRIFPMSNEELKQMDAITYECLVMDITEARSFLFGARACSFVVDLLNCPGVKEHIDATGGWAPVEAMARTLNELHLYEGSENEHFVHLRAVGDLLFVSHCVFVPDLYSVDWFDQLSVIDTRFQMLEHVDSKVKIITEQCEFCFRRLRRKFNFMTKSTFVCGLKTLLAGEMGEYFPLLVIQKDPLR